MSIVLDGMKSVRMALNVDFQNLLEEDVNVACDSLEGNTDLL